MWRWDPKQAHARTTIENQSGKWISSSGSVSHLAMVYFSLSKAVDSVHALFSLSNNYNKGL